MEEPLVAQMIKNLLAVQEAQVLTLGQEEPLEKGTATHSSILAWRIPWTEEPGGLQSRGSQRVGHDWATNTFTFLTSVNWECLYVVYSFKDYNVCEWESLKLVFTDFYWSKLLTFILVCPRVVNLWIGYIPCLYSHEPREIITFPHSYQQ